ncbi:MAG: transcription elongation factor GreA [Clostridia bacterium]|nr:transcription elongation factor GreA [Clostridia bacterium]
MSQERTYTQKGYDALLEKMKQLDEAIEKNKKDISTARAFGDLSENSEYTEAKEEQRKLAYQKEELQDLIKNAVVVEESDTDASVVGIGSFVRVLMVERAKEVEYHIVGSYEADPFSGKISDQSPIGAALLGKRAGDTAEAELPNGNVAHFEIRDVRR